VTEPHGGAGKLPDVGTTVFTVMSRRAAESGAINLGQGFPDYPIDVRLPQLVQQAMAEGHNQYAPMPGVPALLEQIAAKLRRVYGIAVDAHNEITVTLGATEALYSSIQALAGAGDEVLVFDPAYDSYDPAVRLAAAHCVHIPLAPPHFRPDWDRVRLALSERTRLVIINSPQNPACSCLDREDLDALAALLRGRDCCVLADEVYEHMVYDGAQHQSVLAHPELRERSVAVYSFGKTLHATGLRVGYAVAPPALTTELRKVHQYNTFTIATSFQHAIAAYLRERPDCGADLPGWFQAKRDRFAALLEGTGLQLLRSAGSYFQLANYAELDARDDVELAAALIDEAGVATIPLSVFYREPPPMKLLRLCFAKRDETLAEGALRLRQWAQSRRTMG
jgi:methionine transaminase